MNPDDTLPPSAVDDTQPMPSEMRPRHVTRQVTYEVNATPLGASARDFVFAKSNEWSADQEKRQIVPGPPGTWDSSRGSVSSLAVRSARRPRSSIRTSPRCSRTVASSQTSAA